MVLPPVGNRLRSPIRSPTDPQSPRIAGTPIRLGRPCSGSGMARDRILLIDEDQGITGKTAERRTGFHRLLAEVTMDHVGVIFGIDMSRMARNNKDWHHLMEMCAIFGTILADEDRIYDPRDAEDRLLLGFKGTISEYELV